MNKFPLYILLLIVFPCLLACGKSTSTPADKDVYDRYGCMIRHNVGDREIHFIFSADSMFEGGSYALDVLDSTGIKASFFFTGNFLRDSANAPIIRRVINSGHYLGPHSDGHILLCDWDEARTTLVDADSLLLDLDRNFAELARFGVSRDSALYVLPPFEWCNAMHGEAYKKAGYKPVQPSPGILTYRDYTTPDMKEYHSSERMLTQLYEFERKKGLDGVMLILHLGTQSIRADKLYHHLPSIIDSLTTLGYKFARLR